MMDGNKFAPYWETAKAIIGIGLIYYLGDWFGISANFSFFKYILIGYFLVSVAASFWFISANNLKVAAVPATNAPHETSRWDEMPAS